MQGHEVERDDLFAPEEAVLLFRCDGCGDELCEGDAYWSVWRSERLCRDCMMARRHIAAQEAP